MYLHVVQLKIKILDCALGVKDIEGNRISYTAYCQFPCMSHAAMQVVAGQITQLIHYIPKLLLLSTPQEFKTRLTFCDRFGHLYAYKKDFCDVQLLRQSCEICDRIRFDVVHSFRGVHLWHIGYKACLTEEENLQPIH